jgi:hypothetical protein
MGPNNLPDFWLSSQDQHGFLQFIRDLSPGHLRSTYQSYCFLADFDHADEIWKRDTCRIEFVRRGLVVPERKKQGDDVAGWESIDVA